MISLANSEALISFVLLFFAYIFSITLSGNFQAYMAKWMGDDTAEDLGYTEFNPFAFIGFLSLIWFFLLQVMIGRPIPVQIAKIKRSWWPLRILLAFGSRTFFNIVLATVASIAALILCGPQLSLNPSLLVHAMPLARTQLSSTSLILCQFFGAMTVANVILATLSSIRQTIYFFVMYKMHKDYRFFEHADYLIAFGPLLIIFFFGNTILKTFLYIVGCLVFGISQMCGVL